MIRIISPCPNVSTECTAATPFIWTAEKMENNNKLSIIPTPLNKKKTSLAENLNVCMAYLHRKSTALHPSSHRHSGPSHCPCAGGISACLGPLQHVSGTAEYGP